MIEKKSKNYYRVELDGGYSGERILAFKAESEEQVWSFLCEWIDQSTEKDDILTINLDNPLLIRWKDNHYLSINYTGDRDRIDFNSFAFIKVSIKKLNIICFE